MFLDKSRFYLIFYDDTIHIVRYCIEQILILFIFSAKEILSQMSWFGMLLYLISDFTLFRLLEMLTINKDIFMSHVFH